MTEKSFFSIPFAEILIGRNNFSIPPDFLESFEYKDTAANSGDTFAMDFFDSTFGILNLILAGNKHLPTEEKLKFRWGFSDDMSEYRFGQILSSSPGDITRDGVRFHIEGTDLGTASARTKTTARWRGPISNIAEVLALRHGWDEVIEETVPIEEDEFFDGKLAPKVYSQDNKTDLEFLNELALKAESSAYHLFFVGKQQRPVMHFHPKRADRTAPRQVIVNTAQLGAVISFSSEFQGAALIAEGRSEVAAAFTDKITKVTKVISRDARTFDKAPADGKYTSVDGGLRSTLVLPGFTEKEAETVLNSFYDRLSNITIKATLEHQGDVAFEPDTYLDILVLTKNGDKYFTSGIYYVIAVTHKIELGKYTSTLELTKNSSDIGDTRNQAPKVARTRGV